MNFKGETSKYLLLILLLSSMQIVSQTVQIDSIKETTLLDKKATIAQGNISKQRDSLKIVNRDQQILIDSLRFESNRYKAEADTLRIAYQNLKFAFIQTEKQVELKNKDIIYNEKLFKSDLKALRRKRLGLGLSIGYGLNGWGETAFAGVSLNYTLIRF